MCKLTGLSAHSKCLINVRTHLHHPFLQEACSGAAGWPGAGCLPSGILSCHPTPACPRPGRSKCHCLFLDGPKPLGHRCRIQRRWRKEGALAVLGGPAPPPLGPGPATRCGAGRWRQRPRGSAPGHLPAPRESATGGRGRSRPGAGTEVSAGLTGRGGREGCGARGAEPGAGAPSGSRAVSQSRAPGARLGCAGATWSNPSRAAGRPGFHGDAVFAASGDSWVAGREQ